MSEPGEGQIAPDMFCLINDPSSGEQDATLEIWQLGNHDQGLTDAIGRITERNGGVFGPIPKRDEHGITAPSLLMMFELVGNLPRAPKEAQFIAIGQERSCAIRVSYIDPYDTSPTSHPGIHAALGNLIGSQYVSIKRRVITK